MQRRRRHLHTRHHRLLRRRLHTRRRRPRRQRLRHLHHPQRRRHRHHRRPRRLTRRRPPRLRLLLQRRHRLQARRPLVRLRASVSSMARHLRALLRLARHHTAGHQRRPRRRRQPLRLRRRVSLRAGHRPARRQAHRPARPSTVRPAHPRRLRARHLPAHLHRPSRPARRTQQCHPDARRTRRRQSGRLSNAHPPSPLHYRRSRRLRQP